MGCVLVKLKVLQSVAYHYCGRMLLDGVKDLSRLTKGWNAHSQTPRNSPRPFPCPFPPLVPSLDTFIRSVSVELPIGPLPCGVPSLLFSSQPPRMSAMVAPLVDVCECTRRKKKRRGLAILSVQRSPDPDFGCLKWG